MKYGLHKMTWGKYFDPNDIRAFFEDAHRAGADTIEFRIPDKAMEMDLQEISRIRTLAEDNGLEMNFCFAFPEGIDMRSPDENIRKAAVEFLRKGIRAAKALGGLEIGGVLYSNWPTNFSGDMLNRAIRYERRQRQIECMRQVAETAEEYAVPLNFEILNRYEDYTINTVEEGMEFCRDVGSPMCKLLLDVYHLGIEEDDICEAIRRAKWCIGHFHVSEPNRRIPYHTARIDWAEIAKALRSTGYDGTVTMEAVVSFDGPSTYNMRMWRDLSQDSSKDERIEAMKKGLNYIRSYFEIDGE